MNILITGASKGIGRELALELSKDPDNLILTIARSENQLISLSEEAKHGNIVFEAEDIIKLSKEPQKLLKRVKNTFKQLDILINNAGALIPKSFEEMNQDDDDLVISTNLLAPMHFIRALLPIIPSKGHVVNITSMAGFQGSSKYDGLSVYSAAKGALSILSESLAGEYRGKGPSFNSLSLGAVQTEMLEAAFPGFKAPLQPEEMAKFIAWFAMNGNRFFNGRNLPVTVGNP